MLCIGQYREQSALSAWLLKSLLVKFEKARFIQHLSITLGTAFWSGFQVLLIADELTAEIVSVRCRGGNQSHAKAALAQARASASGAKARVSLSIKDSSELCSASRAMLSAPAVCLCCLSHVSKLWQ